MIALIPYDGFDSLLLTATTDRPCYDLQAYEGEGSIESVQYQKTLPLA